MPKKIPVLFLQSQVHMGADSVIHSHVMRHLDRDGFEVHVACNAGDRGYRPPSFDALQAIPGVRMRPTRFAPGASLRRSNKLAAALGAGASAWDLGALARYVVRERIRIIHSSDRRRDSTLAVALAKLTGARSVLHVHVKWSSEYGKAAQWAMLRADAAFAISRFVSDTIVASGKPRAEVHTVLNAIEVQNWQPGRDGASVRREFSIPERAPLLVSVSRLFSWKGQRELLRATAHVKTKLPDVRVLIAGADETMVHGGSFTAELTNLARELGISDNVVFAGDRRDVPEVMAAADLFAMPSFEEPFGLVFLEAMAMQRPVVALNNGGTPEVVEHGRTGLLSDPGDIEGLANNILELLLDRERRESMGRAGRARVLERFGAERLASEAGRAYRAILGEPA